MVERHGHSDPPRIPSFEELVFPEKRSEWTDAATLAHLGGQFSNKSVNRGVRYAFVLATPTTYPTGRSRRRVATNTDPNTIHGRSVLAENVGDEPRVVAQPNCRDTDHGGDITTRSRYLDPCLQSLPFCDFGCSVVAAVTMTSTQDSSRKPPGPQSLVPRIGRFLAGRRALSIGCSTDSECRRA